MATVTLNPRFLLRSCSSPRLSCINGFRTRTLVSWIRMMLQRPVLIGAPIEQRLLLTNTRTNHLTRHGEVAKACHETLDCRLGTCKGPGKRKSNCSQGCLSHEGLLSSGYSRAVQRWRTYLLEGAYWTGENMASDLRLAPDTSDLAILTSATGGLFFKEAGQVALYPSKGRKQ